MIKLLVLCCLLCLAGSFGHPSGRVREAAERFRAPRGCADRAAGWLACARVNGSDALAPHPRDCHLFYYCSSAGARPACRRCPAGLHFNAELQVCDWPDHANCTAAPRPRPTGQPGHNGTTLYPTSSHVTDPVTHTGSTPAPDPSTAPTTPYTDVTDPATDSMTTTPYPDWTTTYPPWDRK